MGYTQTAIAAKCGCARSTINEIKSGVITKPSYEIGALIVGMHKAATLAASKRDKAKVTAK